MKKFLERLKEVYTDSNALLNETTLASEPMAVNLELGCKLKAVNSSINGKGFEKTLGFYLLNKDIKENPIKFLAVSGTIQLLKSKRLGWKRTLIEDLPVEFFFTGMAYIQTK